MIKHRLIRTALMLCALQILVTGCSSFRPTDIESLAFKERAETVEINGVSVTVSVLTKREADSLFSPKLSKRLIQPVWVEIDNQSPQGYWLSMRSFDANYYSAHEAASAAHGKITGVRDEVVTRFRDAQISRVVPSEGRSSGFLYGNMKLGTKAVNIKLVGDEKELDFEFFLTVPGLKADWQRVEFQTLYTATEQRDYSNADEFRGVLEELMCCTTRKNGEGSGDPINMIVIGSANKLQNFVRAGWDETEIITTGSSWRTFKAFVTGGEYKYSPISALYVFKRPQDVSLQKARDSIHERNHLRLWLAPFTFRGELVWTGAISRDIGVFWTTRTWNFTSHAIDSDIDEARNYILEDLASTGGLEAYGFVGGVGVSTPDEPQENLLGTPWWTNGRRVVLLLSDEPTNLGDVRTLQWTNPGRLQGVVPE